MLRIIVLLLVSCPVGSIEPRTDHVCYGSDFRISSELAKVYHHLKLYFTPSNPIGPRKLVMDSRQVKDPRYKMSSSDVIVPYVTEKDEGMFSIMKKQHSTINDFIRLKIKDCSEKEFKLYGDSHSFKIPRNAESLEYNPWLYPEQPRILWNRISPRTSTESRGYQRYNSWIIRSLTPADNGFYSFRDRDQRFISRTEITVNERTESYEKKVSESFQISFADLLNPAFASLVFDSELGPGSTVLMRRGDMLVNKREWHSMSGRIEKLSYTDPRRGIIIHNLEEADSGRYKVSDGNGTLALVVDLLVLKPVDTSLYISIGGTVALLLAFCCCYVKCCCKKKASKGSNPVSQTVVDYADDSSQPSGPSYSAPPAALPNYHTPRYISPSEPTSSSTEPPPYILTFSHVSPRSDQLSSSAEPPPNAAGWNRELPTTPLGSDYPSSDPDPQFVLKGKSFLTDPPLSSDITFCDVYTSDKLNFQ